MRDERDSQRTEVDTRRDPDGFAVDFGTRRKEWR
jgi:hypothetical protein